MKSTAGQKILHIFVWIFLIGTSFFVLYPLVYVASAAFSPQQNIAALNIIPFGDGLTLKNFVYLFENTDFPIWFKNTLIISVATTVSTVFVCALSAYIFSMAPRNMLRPARSPLCAGRFCRKGWKWSMKRCFPTHRWRIWTLPRKRCPLWRNAGWWRQ